MSKLMNTTIGKLLETKAREVPNNDALVYVDRGLRLSYNQFNEACRHVAKAFIGLGMKQGDHVAIWASNTPEWVTTQFATGKMGAVLVTVNTNYQARELEYLLKQSDSKTLILMESFKGVSYLDIIYEILPELKTATPGQFQSNTLPYLKNVIVLSEERYPGMFNWRDFLAFADQVTHAALDERLEQLDPSDVINMQYTSGTTGFPKGVMLTHHNLINTGKHAGEGMNFTYKDRLCIPVPFFHCFGCVLGTLVCVTSGATMVPVQEFNVADVLTSIEKERCTAVHGVPTMFIAELNDPAYKSYDLSSLRTGIMAGSTCPIEVMKKVSDDMGANELTIVYGQTETSPGITQTRTGDSLDVRVQTVGRAMPHIEAKIVDPSTRQEVPLGVQGEICCRGYNVMKGYYKNQEATDNTIDEDGWLYTGDLAVMDEAGNCTITGRLKDMIIRGGENIYPREVEEFLYTHPALLDVQVIGVPDAKYGEEVMAWIRVKEGMEIEKSELIAYCKGKIAHYKIPRYIEVCEEFPMTASGKIQKFKLKEQAINKMKTL
ncbi:AMP-binding protein [Shouchella hunanensis]|uniref:AMP-binding protein n=1 Tax=Shouchella hunanensis TaxID=766894 RepID=A0ABY7WE72_9BACI|nr:AMP-binding protein [Shouchella hunanensis]WDF04965.1 AMP-binding protein [Shouchella hunanensis]